MFELKLQYLNEENYSLKRQVNDLKHILSIESNENQLSLLYQFRQANEKLSRELQQAQDQLLLQREARQIERVDHNQIVELLNRCIFELKEQIALLQQIVRQEKKYEYQPNAIEKWFKNKLIDEQNQLYHKYSHPVIYFEVMQGLINALDHSTMELQSENQDINEEDKLLLPTFDQQSQDHSEIVLKQSKISKIKQFSRVSEEPILEQSNILLNQPKVTEQLYHSEQQNFISNRKIESNEAHSWLKDKSSIYFLKKKQIRDLHLDMQKAKYVQMQCLKAQDKEQPPKSILQTNIPLLKKSYIELIGSYQILKKKNRAHERYIQELEQRNELLLKSRICAQSQ